MKCKSFCFITAVLVLSVNGFGLQSGVFGKLTTDPNKALFVYEDVQNFLRVFKLLPAGGDAVEILQKEYLDKGSAGLKMFVQKYDLTAERLAKAIKKYPQKYAALKDMTQWLGEQEESTRRAFAKLKRLIPQAVFPPTYFLVGSYRGIASGSAEGQLVTVERYERNAAHHATLTIHELVHFQQAMAVGMLKYQALFGPEKNLLGLCIREGTAEFFADLVTGKITQEEARDFVIKHEKELWEQFRKEMNGRETGDWMWKQPKNPDQPPHIGYYLGCRIVQAYYENAKDKAAAVQEILSVTDYPAFLEKSGYAKKFENLN